MAAPKFAPVAATSRARGYTSTDFVPEGWASERPGDLDGVQPRDARLGHQGPDQGFALLIGQRLKPTLKLQAGERAEDAVQGCLGVTLRRASLYGRAPVVHDWRIAFTIFGFLDDNPPTELVELRKRLFEGVGNTAHHYVEGRAIVDMVPETTLRQTPQEVSSAYPARWRNLVGA